MKNAMKSLLMNILVFTIFIMVYYLLAVLMLLILSSTFSAGIENYWITAVPVTIWAIILLIGSYIYFKMRKRNNTPVSVTQPEENTDG